MIRFAHLLSQNMTWLNVLLYLSITVKINGFVPRSESWAELYPECEGQYSEQEYASVVQPLWREAIQLEHVLKGNFYLSKQNSVASLRTLLITGLSQIKADYKQQTAWDRFVSLVYTWMIWRGVLWRADSCPTPHASTLSICRQVMGHR